MRYRDARLLNVGDKVVRKSDQVVLQVESLEIYGQYKLVKLHCTDSNGSKVVVANDEVKELNET